MLTKNELPCQTSYTWSVSCYIVAFYCKRQKDNKQLLRAKSFANFWNFLKHVKGNTGYSRI